MSLKVPVHVEAAMKSSCSVAKSVVKKQLEQYLQASCPVFEDGFLTIPPLGMFSLCNTLEWIRVSDLFGKSVSFWQADLRVHVFTLSDQPPERDYLNSGGASEGEEDLSAAEQWELPNALLLGLWESIIVETSVKRRLLGYCDTSLQFADAGVDSALISWNRMTLLHGPPGTGKTSLCRALAQKMFIRNCDRYETGCLLEINSHSLFSKWFSESGKLVMKLFDHIADTADDESCLTCVLIDEVESIASARSSSVRSNEPGDAVRVVNAVLTSLDSLKRRSNVLILCTSNMLDAIDPAFLDRIDMKAYLGPPPCQARYEILRSCVEELMLRGIVTPSEALLPYSSAVEQSQTHAAVPAAHSSAAETLHAILQQEQLLVVGATGRAGGASGGGSGSGVGGGTESKADAVVSSPARRPSADSLDTMSTSKLLMQTAIETQNMSGRSLRKLPVKAHAYYLEKPTATLRQFLTAMLLTVRDEKADGEHCLRGTPTS